MGYLRDILILTAFVLVLALAIFAVIRGIRGIKSVGSFVDANKKVRIGFLAVSVVHMLAGFVLILCYVIAGIFILITRL